MLVNYKNYDDLPLTLDAYDLQVALRISRASIYRLLHDPQFPSIRVGGRLLVPRDKFLSWLERQTTSCNQLTQSEKVQKRSDYSVR